MVDDRAIDKLLDLFYNPQYHTIYFKNRRVVLSEVEIFRSEELLRITLPNTIVVIPMTASALERCRGVVRVIRRCCSELFSQCEIERVRVEECDCIVDALIYPTAIGTPLIDRVTEELDDQEIVALYSAVELMEGELHRCRLEVNIDPANLVIGVDGRLYPLTLETTINGTTQCEPLREWLRNCCGAMPTQYTPVELDQYDTLREYRVGDYISTSYPHEGRILVCDRDGLYGFVDETGEVIITPQYLLAEDFRESRAVVKTANGYGVIDLWGEVIIPTQYQDLSYNEETGISCAKLNDMWQYLSYDGAPLSEPSIEYPDEAFRG